MIYNLLKDAIENPNPYIENDTLKTYIEDFYAEGEIDRPKYDELVGMFPIEEEIVVE